MDEIIEPGAFRDLPKDVPMRCGICGADGLTAHVEEGPDGLKITAVSICEHLARAVAPSGSYSVKKG